MPVKVIPTETDGTLYYGQRTELDGVEFILTFIWNERDSFWYLTIHTADDTPIRGCESIKLVTGSFPLRRVSDANRPIGQLYVYSETSEDPGLYSLGKQTALLYVPKADFDEWVSSV